MTVPHSACNHRGLALAFGATLAACVSFTSSVDAGVVGYYADAPTSPTALPIFGGANARSAAFSFTAGTSTSLTQLKVLSEGLFSGTSVDVEINLYQYTGSISSFTTPATALATWSYTSAITSSGRQANTFNLTGPTANVTAATQYVLVLSVTNDAWWSLTRGDGTRLGDDGWTTYGGFNDSGAYYYTSFDGWGVQNFNWELTFGSTAAVPGAGMAGLSMLGLAGMSRRRRRR